MGVNGAGKTTTIKMLSCLTQPTEGEAFVDEPTLGLDVIARSELWDVIRSLKGKITIILTTHYMEEAEGLSDRIAIMKNGRLLALDTAERLKQQAHADTFENAFIAIVKGADQ